MQPAFPIWVFRVWAVEAPKHLHPRGSVAIIHAARISISYFPAGAAERFVGSNRKSRVHSSENPAPPKIDGVPRACFRATRSCNSVLRTSEREKANKGPQLSLASSFPESRPANTHFSARWHSSACGYNAEDIAVTRQEIAAESDTLCAK